MGLGRSGRDNNRHISTVSFHFASAAVAVDSSHMTVYCKRYALCSVHIHTLSLLSWIIILLLYLLI